VCTPGKALAVAPASLTLAPNGSSQFTACTQYFSNYTVTVSPSGVLTAPTSPSTVTPTEPANGTIYFANITVTAGASCGNATITIKDKKRNTQSVNVSVAPCTFHYTGAVQNFTVPQGVTQITVDAVGASGGQGCSPSGFSNAGGLGYELKAMGIAVTPGQTLYVYVGGSPVAGAATCGAGPYPSYASAGFNGGGSSLATQGISGGGGGGASDVRTNTNALTTGNDTRLIVAGGGGGSTSSPSGTPGGNGGYSDGAAGSYWFTPDTTDPGPVLAGQGGTQSSGGVGGQISIAEIIASCIGNQGSLGLGGSSTGCALGAGGGGYYGGGSAAAYVLKSNDPGRGAGGGGSSFVQTGATVVTQQVATDKQCDASNNGCVTISW
jgi:hypothetical protein